MPGHRHRTFPRIGRTLPPAVAPLSAGEFLQGMHASLRPRQEIARFTAEIKTYFQVRHGFLVSSGKTALYVLLRALQQLRPGANEVIIPAFTCYSVPSVVVRAGLKITLCDIDPRTLDFDFNRLESLVGKGQAANALLCIVPTHLFGLPADVGRVKKLLQSKGLAHVPVIEDAAQAMGASSPRSGRLGTEGDAGFFSLGRGKALSTGEGGVILTDRDDVARAVESSMAGLASPSMPAFCRLLATTAALTFLTHPAWFWLPKALPWLKLGETVFDPAFANHRLTAFQAGLARNWAAKLERLQAARAEQADRWRASLPAGIGHYHSGGHPLIRFPVRVRSRSLREHVLAWSERCGYGIMPVYPASVEGIGALQGLMGGLPVPNAEALAKELLTLPVHRFVTARDRDRIAVLLSGERPSHRAGVFSLAGHEEI